MPVPMAEHPPILRAVKRASARRILADMAQAAWIVEEAAELFPSSTTMRRAYLFGQIDGQASLTVKACLLTAIGG